MSKELDDFDAMLNGTFTPPEPEAEPEETEDDTTDEVVEDEVTEDNAEEELDDEANEDTDLEVEEDEEEELDQENDDALDDDSEVNQEDEGEDTPVENDDDLDGEDKASENDEETPETTPEDGTDTTQPNDGDAAETDTIDYKAFHDAIVNAEFKVNGKLTTGFKDPAKIIQSIQMAGGYADKMAGFKPYKKFMGPLRDRGMLEDSTKFDLAMNILDGDKEAIKNHLKSLEIDPLELDMDEIKYTPTPATASEATIAIDDSLERARANGYEDNLRQIIGTEWDKDSFSEFVSNPQVRADLHSHIESGLYDTVHAKMLEMRRFDVDGTYGELTVINQYRNAVHMLQQEEQQVIAEKAKKQETLVTPTLDATKLQEEKAKIAKAKEAEAYKRKVDARKANAAKARRQAALSSKKRGNPRKSQILDPLEAEGEDLDEIMELLISGKR